MMMVLTLGCGGAAAATARVPAGTVLVGAALFVTAQVCYTLAVALYDSLLVRLAEPRHLGRVSAFGWAFGFVGGMVALFCALLLLRGIPAAAQLGKLGDAFLLAGALFAVLGTAALYHVRAAGPPRRERRGDGSTPRGAFAQVVATLRQWRENRETFRFLAAQYLINDALVTILFFVVIVLRERFGLSVEGLLWLALLYHVLALPSTLAFGHAADRWGHRCALYVMLAVLAAAVLLLALGSAPITPVLVVFLLGTVYGSIQAVSRSLLARLVPPERAAQMFGFNALAGRLSAALGPLLFGAVVALTDSQRVALLSVLAFLAAGAAVLAKVRMPGPAVGPLQRASLGGGRR